MGLSFPQLGGGQPQSAFALCQAEPTLHFHPFTFILAVLSLVSGPTFLGAAQGRTRKPDAMLLAEAEILTVSVYLVRQNAAGIMPFPFPKSFDYHLQVSGLVVCVKRTVFQASPTVHNTDVKLCTKFHSFSGFSTHNGANKGLAHADDPVRNTVRVMIVHVLLLFIDGADRVQTLRLPGSQSLAEG